MDPHDYDLLGLCGQGNTVIDTCLLFVLCHGMQIFQRISHAVHYVMHQHGFQVINYVDDFIGIASLSAAQRSYIFLLELLWRLGLDVSMKKLVPPSTNVMCLGVWVDTERRTVSILEEKLSVISETVNNWLT